MFSIICKLIICILKRTILCKEFRKTYGDVAIPRGNDILLKFNLLYDSQIFRFGIPFSGKIKIYRSMIKKNSRAFYDLSVEKPVTKSDNVFSNIRGILRKYNYVKEVKPYPSLPELKFEK